MVRNENRSTDRDFHIENKSESTASSNINNIDQHITFMKLELSNSHTANENKSELSSFDTVSVEESELSSSDTASLNELIADNKCSEAPPK